MYQQPRCISRSLAASTLTRRLAYSPSWSVGSQRLQSFHTQLQPREVHHRQSRQYRPIVLSATAATRSVPSAFRPYHSKYHADPVLHEYSNSQTTILSAALSHIPEYGFTREALTLGARDAGFLDVSIQLFPQGEFDLILFWLASRRGLLRAKVENGLFENSSNSEGQSASANRSGMTVEEKVKALLLERLKMNMEIKHQWQGALSLMSFPSNIPLSLSELHALSSDILSLAGDQSIDFAWYTKRLSVAAIYASAEVAMTRDSSHDLSETVAFVHRRFEDCDSLRSELRAVTQCLSFMGSTAAGLGRSWGLKI